MKSPIGFATQILIVILLVLAIYWFLQELAIL